MQITIETKEVYGNTLYYPVCDKAKTFAEMVNAKTLTPSVLRNIKQLGFQITIKQKELAI